MRKENLNKGQETDGDFLSLVLKFGREENITSVHGCL